MLWCAAVRIYRVDTQSLSDYRAKLVTSLTPLELLPALARYPGFVVASDSSFGNRPFQNLACANRSAHLKLNSRYGINSRVAL